MKYVLATLSICFGNFANATAPVTTERQAYSSCLEWIAVNGLKTSKKYELFLAKNEPALFIETIYNGTSSCDLQKRVVRLLRILNVSSWKVHDQSSADIMAEDRADNTHYSIMLSADAAIVDFGNTPNLSFDPSRTILLQRLQ